MTHVRVQRLAAGDAQEHAAQDQKPGAAGSHHETDGVARIHRRNDLGALEDRRNPKQRDDQKPQHHHRPKRTADLLRAEALRREEHQQNDDRHRHDIGLEGVRDDIDTLERAQNRNRRRDDTVAIDQRSAEQAHAGQ